MNRSPRTHQNRLPGLLAGCVLALATAVVRADTFPLPPSDVDMVGSLKYTHARQEETLLDIARRFDLGQNEIVHANPRVDRWMPGDGTLVFLPKRYILPDVARKGLVLNIAELRMYYFPESSGRYPTHVTTHPMSIGRMDWRTPLGKTKIVAKQEDPVWRPPKSIKAEHAAKGDPLPDVVPAGPDNPLGRYAIRLGIPGYLIHSTNKPYGVGMRVSHGCIRMYPEDIEVMFPDIPVGTRVQIVNQPIKLGWFADTLFVEAHPPLEEHEISVQNALNQTIARIEAEHPHGTLNLDSQALGQALSERRGVPVPISTLSYPDMDSYEPPPAEAASEPPLDSTSELF